MDNEKKPTTNVKKTVKKPASKGTGTKKKTTSNASKKSTNTTKKKPTTTKKTTNSTPKKNTKPVVKKEVVEEVKVVPKVEEKIEETPVINKKTVTKEVPPINYVMIISAILALIIITFFLAKTFGMTTKKDITKSYLVTNQIVSNELTKDNIDSAINKDKSFVLLTTLNNEEEYNLEKELRGIIEANHLKDNFYVFNNDTNTNVDLNNTFKLDGKSIKIPVILYYKDGQLIDVVQREDEKMIEAADFLKLLDIYEITK